MKIKGRKSMYCWNILLNKENPFNENKKNKKIDTFIVRTTHSTAYYYNYIFSH